jgi:hypothetical protein
MIKKKTYLLAIIIIIVIVGSNVITYYLGMKAGIRTGLIGLSVITGKIVVYEAKYLEETSKIKDYKSLRETVIIHQIAMLDLLEDPVRILVGEETILLDKSFLHLRLGLLYQEDNRKDLADREFNISLELYNMNRKMNNKPPANLKELNELFQKLHGEENWYKKTSQKNNGVRS